MRVRLRFPRRSDHARLHALLCRLGLEADDLAVSRTLRFQPRDRTVICASVFVGSREVLVGFAAGERDADTPDLVLVDESAAPGLRGLLEGTARAHASRHVA